ALKGAGHRLPILRNYRPTGYDNLAVDLHRYVKRVVIDVFHCDHGGSHRTIDFMLHPVPWNSGRHIYLLAVPVDPRDRPLDPISIGLEYNRAFFFHRTRRAFG